MAALFQYCITHFMLQLADQDCSAKILRYIGREYEESTWFP